MRRAFIFAMIAASSALCEASVTPLDSLTNESINVVLNQSLPKTLKIGKVKVANATVDQKKKTVSLDFNEVFGYVPMSDSYLAEVEAAVREKLPAEYAGYKLKLTIGGRDVADYLPEAEFNYKKTKKRQPFVYAVDDTRHPKKGLDGKIIAMWQSHGWYFEQKENRWEWQRARIFQTVEDLYTQSYVMPYLMPMLENAGAYVMSPRERDTKNIEIIIDNNGGLAAKGGYSEQGGEYPWEESTDAGFAYLKKSYEGFDNPFKHGTYRTIPTAKGKRPSVAEWSASIPEDGEYAVYVSYATLPNSTEDARYTVHTAGGDRQFVINQKMGGGTWIYLGHFYFKKGQQKLVSLSNESDKRGRVVTADAVKIGGGYGNIARKVSDVVTENVKSAEADKVQAKEVKSRIKSEYKVSGYPRFTEGARYWLQWAGIPDSVYSPSNGTNDYTDDYRCRGTWVNYLAGGSSVLPDNKGLNIPVDLAFAFHSDAGTTMDDTIIGTLGIYFTNKGDKYVNGTDRMVSHQLTNYVMTNIVNDVRAQFDSQWVRRGMWDASYFEARVPEVPTMLLELLSHQNFADMRYGLDPKFRFTVSRAIYKGMVQFFAKMEGKDDYMIQPLPVNSFAIDKKDSNKFVLSWKETVDTLCDRAQPSAYVIYERVADGGFRQLAVTSSTSYEVTVNDNLIHSYKVVAMNDGGLSFPSEILALGVAKESKGDVLVVNGFTRVSAPDSFDLGNGIAGFYNSRDGGVPYMSDICFIGDMFEFRREVPWTSDDSSGFGASRANYEDKVIAGNTFDYPYMHGEAIMNAGYSFVSTSLKSVESGYDMKKYGMTDLILGKQKQTQSGRGEKPDLYHIYSRELQAAVKAYCENGGDILVTGSYVATDVWDNKKATDETRKFASDVLGYKWRVGQASITGEAYMVPTYFDSFGELDLDYYTTLNSEFYAVESPDAMYPTFEDKGCTLLRYTENNIPAAVANDFDTYKTCIVGFPFETIKSESARNTFMKQVLEFFKK